MACHRQGRGLSVRLPGSGRGDGRRTRARAETSTGTRASVGVEGVAGCQRSDHPACTTSASATAIASAGRGYAREKRRSGPGGGSWWT